MNSSVQRVTAGSGRALGRVLVVVLSVVSVALGPAPALGTPEGPDPVGEWPLRPQPEVVDGFDPPEDPWGAGHRGVDLLGTPGQRVHSALPGRVSFAGQLAGRGVVVVDHGDTRTTYEPVTAGVRVGERVAGGTPIGSLQLAGSHCFPRACLHWGWLRGETYLNPLDLVGGGPVRLLPLWRDEPVTGQRTSGSTARAAAPTQPYAAWRPMLETMRTP
jgi:murein DD-endopeptidase MepM/ murein hydrolase activator NlpD